MGKWKLPAWLHPIYINELNQLLEEIISDAVKISSSTCCELQQTQMGLCRTSRPLIICLLAREEPGLFQDRNVAGMSISAGFEVQQPGITSIGRSGEQWQKEENSSWWDWLPN